MLKKSFTVGTVHREGFPGGDQTSGRWGRVNSRNPRLEKRDRARRARKKKNVAPGKSSQGQLSDLVRTGFKRRQGSPQAKHAQVFFEVRLTAVLRKEGGEPGNVKPKPDRESARCQNHARRIRTDKRGFTYHLPRLISTH